PNGARACPKRNALGANQIVHAAHTSDELPIGYACSNEEGVVAAHQFVGFVDKVHLQAVVDALLGFLIIYGRKPALDESTQCLDRAGCNNALWAPTDTHAHVDARLDARSVDTPSDVTVQ